MCSHCPKTCGTRVESRIAVADCSAFGNSGGQLICDAPANADGIPAGSYTDSCGGCAIDGDVLSCSHCSGTDGGHHASTLAVSSCDAADGQQIGNSDGQLACEDPAAEPQESDGDGRRLEELEKNAEDVPSGSYLDSCGGCALEDEVRRRCKRHVYIACWI